MLSLIHILRHDQPDASQVFQRFFSEVGPAQNGGNYKRNQAAREQRGAYVRNFAECQRSKHGAVRAGNVRMRDDAGGQHNSRQGADDDGMPEGAAGRDAVSYTHLIDIRPHSRSGIQYEELHGVGIGQVYGDVVVFFKGCGDDAGHGFKRKGGCLVAVSYTHLDVYKRQIQ